MTRPKPNWILLQRGASQPRRWSNALPVGLLESGLQSIKEVSLPAAQVVTFNVIITAGHNGARAMDQTLCPELYMYHLISCLQQPYKGNAITVSIPILQTRTQRLIGFGVVILNLTMICVLLIS